MSLAWRQNTIIYGMGYVAFVLLVTTTTATLTKKNQPLFFSCVLFHDCPPTQLTSVDYLRHQTVLHYHHTNGKVKKKSWLIFSWMQFKLLACVHICSVGVACYFCLFGGLLLYYYANSTFFPLGWRYSCTVTLFKSQTSVSNCRGCNFVFLYEGRASILQPPTPILNFYNFYFRYSYWMNDLLHCWLHFALWLLYISGVIQ